MIQASTNSTFKSRLEKKLEAVNEEIEVLEVRRDNILQDIFRLKGRCHHCEKHSGSQECLCNPKLAGNALLEVSRG